MKKRMVGFSLCLLLAAVVITHAQLDDPFGVDVSVAAAADSARDLVVRIDIPDAHILYANKLSVSVDRGSLRPLAIPGPKPKEDPFTGEMVDVYAQDTTFRYRLEAPDDAVVTVNYLGCNPELCFMPQSHTFPLSAHMAGAETAVSDGDEPAARQENAPSVGFEGFRVTGRAAGYMRVDDFLSFIETVESGQGMERGRVEQIVADHGLWIGVLAILVFGVLLNLTPCVLPMIPVNLAIIGAGAQAGSRQRGFLLGAVYGLAIALVYGLLGVVVVLTGAQFGQLNASPWFNLGIAALFVVLSLAMLGVFNIDFSRFQPGGIDAKARGPFVTAFIFGGVAALLAGACVAPVVISVLVLSTEFYQRGSQGALLLPFVLGLGMALPWPFAGAGLSLLPKPGRWMERVKIGFGIVILIAAGYYGMLGISLLRFTGTTESPSIDADAFWQTSPAAAVAEARQTGRPLFVDFWASWCKNCKAMDASTLKDPAVRDALGSYVRLKYQAEDPSKPATKAVLESLGVRGLPTYVVLEVEE